MKEKTRSLEKCTTVLSALTLLVGALIALASPKANAQCPAMELATGLKGPQGVILSKKGNLLVSETGTNSPNTGRISIVDLSGKRRTLIDGLPSGISSEGGVPSGPSGLFLRGRTLYLAIGVGDSVMAGPAPQSTAPNPNPSSPLFSSVLAIHFSANVEKNTAGFRLAPADQQTLAGHKPVTLTNSFGETLTIELVVNFPDYTPDPRPDFAGNVRNSNPFDLVAVGNKLYVTNGGQNLLHQVDLATGAFSVLASFPNTPNPKFNPNDPSTGGPTVEAVPTGIAYSDGKLLVTLFRGFPFADGTSAVVQIDPVTGSQIPFITGLKTAIDVLPIRADSNSGETDNSYLVLEHSSGPFLSPPGLLLRFNTQPAGSSSTIANCLVNPTAMTLDEKTGTLYVAGLDGRIVAIPVAAEAFETFNFDPNAAVAPAVRNISTRGFVQSGDNVLIGGFIVGAGANSDDIRVVVRAIGPSLSSNGLSAVLPDPILELHDGNGAMLLSNDNWKETQQAELEATGLAPKNDLESAIVTKLPAGAYTAVVRGKTNATGIALVEVYNLTN